MAEGGDDQTLTAWLGSWRGVRDAASAGPGATARDDSGVRRRRRSQSDTARFYLFEATAGFLKRAAAEQPSLLVLEDLHAADDPSLLLLRYLARDLRDARLLVVGTYRDVEVWRSPGVERVRWESWSATAS